MKKNAKQTDRSILCIAPCALVLYFVLLELSTWWRSRLMESAENKCGVCGGVAVLSIHTLYELPDESPQTKQVTDAMCTDTYFDRFLGSQGELFDMGDRSSAQLMCEYLIHEDNTVRDSGLTFRQVIDNGLKGKYKDDPEKDQALRMVKHACVRTGMCEQSDFGKLKEAVDRKREHAKSFNSFIEGIEKAL
jgi:hypothetical protein